MKTPFLASFIIFIIWLAYEISKTRKKQARAEDGFWDKEQKANETRRKPLDDLNYITIPFDRLPMEILTENEQIREYHEMLHSLSNSPIVNFTGYTNTELKLEYGAPNITLLTRYDQSYTILACTLQKWADKLYQESFTAEAKTILEFAVSTGTDVSSCYRLLASIYSAERNKEGIAHLIQKAASLNSVSQKVIVRILQEFDR